MPAPRSLTALLVVTAIPGLRCQNEVGDPAPATPVALSTADGSQFLLLPTGGPPLVHWTHVSPAGPAEDPVGIPGLARAAARAALSGTLEIGSLDQRREMASLTRLDEMERALARRRAAGETITDEARDELDAARREADALADPLAWQRLLAAAPATDLEFETTLDSVRLTFTTSVRGLEEAARLLRARREGALLRGIHRERTREQGRARGRWNLDRMAPVRAELATLAFPGHPLGRYGEQGNGRGILDRRSAITVWQHTQQPGRTLHVLTGGFDIEQVRPLLERVFDRSELPDTGVQPAPTPRHSAGSRTAVIPGARRPAVAIGLPIDRSATDALKWGARWLGGRGGSALRDELATRGIEGAEVRCAAPYPPGAVGGLLMVEVRAAADTESLGPKCLDALRALAQRKPSAEELERIRVGFDAERVALLRDARQLGITLAQRVLVHREAPASVLLPPTPPPAATLTGALRKVLLRSNAILVEWKVKR